VPSRPGEKPTSEKYRKSIVIKERYQLVAKEEKGLIGLKG
jgi:hypothetical protein